MKDKISREQIETEEEPSNFEGFDDITAPCDLCGEENVGVGTPVIMMIPGMIFPSREFDVPMFVPDPDAKLQIVKLPNNQLGFVTDETVTKYTHEQCYTDLVEQAMYAEEAEDDEDDEDEEEEDEEDE